MMGVVNDYIIITALSLYNQVIESLGTERSRTIFTNQNSWSRLQMLLQATCMWLPLVAVAW